MSHKKVSFLSVCLLGVLFLGMSVGLFRLAGSLPQSTPAAVTTAAGGGEASISPTILDAETGLPIAGAAIVIPQADIQCYTDAAGGTVPLSVPVLPDSRYANLQAQPWGDLLILVYADGYTPTAYTCTGLYHDASLLGPVIRLQAGDGQRFYAAQPASAWVSALLQKYTP